MTPEERKRGLRAAVQAKLQAIVDSKHDCLERLGATPTDRELLSLRWSTELLWDVIDSLVDQCATAEAVVAEFMQDVQAAGGPKEVRKQWPDLIVTYNKARMLQLRPAESAPAKVSQETPDTKFEVTFTLESDIGWDSDEQAFIQIGGAVRHHLRHAGVNVIGPVSVSRPL